MAVARSTVQFPYIQSLLHSQPYLRTVAQQFSQSNSHVRSDWATFMQQLGYGAPGYAQTIGKFQLRQPQGRQDIFPQHLTGVSGPAFFGRAWYP